VFTWAILGVFEVISVDDSAYIWVPDLFRV